MDKFIMYLHDIKSRAVNPNYEEQARLASNKAADLMESQGFYQDYSQDERAKEFKRLFEFFKREYALGRIHPD